MQQKIIFVIEYKIIGEFGQEGQGLKAEWKVSEKSKLFESPLLYNETGFKNNNKAEEFRKAFEEELNTKIVEKKKSIVDDRAKQKFADYIVDWANRNKRKKRKSFSPKRKSNEPKT